MLHYFAMLKVGRIQFDRLNIMWIKRHDWVDNRQASGKLSPHTPWLCETQRRPPSLVGGPPTRGRHTCYMHTHTHTHTHTRKGTHMHTHTHTHTSTWLPMSVQSNKKKCNNNKKHVYLAILCPRSQCVCVCSCLSVFGCVLKSYIPSSAGVISLQILMICVWVRVCVCVCVCVCGREGGLNGQGSHK